MTSEFLAEKQKGTEWPLSNKGNTTCRARFLGKRSSGVQHEVLSLRELSDIQEDILLGIRNKLSIIPTFNVRHFKAYSV